MGKSRRNPETQRGEAQRSGPRRDPERVGAGRSELRSVVDACKRDGHGADLLGGVPASEVKATLRAVNRALGNHTAGAVATAGTPARSAPTRAAKAAATPARTQSSGAARRPIVQTKLIVTGTSDPLEREADELAEVLLRPLDHAPPRDDDPTDSRGGTPRRLPISLSPAPATIQGSGFEVPDALAADLSTLASEGDPLPLAERAYFEPRLGVDLGDVRVHDGPRAAALCMLLQAHAFAFGRHIVLGGEARATFGVDARRLLAHELVHVVQQGAVRELPLERAPRRPATATPRPADRKTAESGRPSRRRRRPADDASTVVMRAAKSASHTDEIKAIADRQTGTIRVVRVNKRGEIVAGLAEIVVPKGEKVDAKQIEADFNGRSDYAVTSAKITVPKKYVVRANPKHDVKITKGTEAERRIDQLEQEAKDRREQVLAYLKEQHGKNPQLDDDQIADIAKTDGYKEWAALDRSGALAWLRETGSTDGKWVSGPGGRSTYYRPEEWDHKALTAAARDPEFLAWQAARQRQAKDEENANILAMMRSYTQTDNISLADARKLYEGLRRDELYNQLQQSSPTGVTVEEASRMNAQQFHDEMETRGVTPELAQRIWKNFQDRSYDDYERQQAKKPGGLPPEVRNEDGEVVGYLTTDYKTLGLMGGVGKVTTKFLDRHGNALDIRETVVLTPSVAFWQEMSRSVPILSNAIFAYEAATGDSLDLRDVYSGGRKLSPGERLDRYISFLPLADTGRQLGEAAGGISFSGADLDLVIKDIGEGNWYHPKHSRHLSDDERWGKLILGGVGLLMDAQGPIRERMAAAKGVQPPHPYYRYVRMSGTQHKLARLRIAVELRLRSALFDPDAITVGPKARGAHVGGDFSVAPKEHISALGLPGVPVLLNPKLGKGISIKFVRGTYGLVSGIVVFTGAHASVADIAAHAKYVRLLQKFQGTMGALRRVFIAIKDKISGDKTPLPGTPRHKVQMEVEKLTGRIQARGAALVDLEGPQLREMVGEIKQLHDHIAAYKRMEADPSLKLDEIAMHDPRRSLIDDDVDESPESHNPAQERAAGSPYAKRAREIAARQQSSRPYGSSGEAPELQARERAVEERVLEAEPAVHDMDAWLKKLEEMVDFEGQAKAEAQQHAPEQPSAQSVANQATRELGGDASASAGPPHGTADAQAPAPAPAVGDHPSAPASAPAPAPAPAVAAHASDPVGTPTHAQTPAPSAGAGGVHTPLVRPGQTGAHPMQKGMRSHSSHDHGDLGNAGRHGDGHVHSDASEAVVPTRRHHDPPRTPAARAECQHVLDVMERMGISPEARKVVTVYVHADGTVSVGLSGRPGAKNRAFAQQLEHALNGGAPTKKRPPKYNVARDTMNVDELVPVSGGNSLGECAEPKAAEAANPNRSPIVGTDTRWRGEGENPYPYTGTNTDGAPVDPRQMNPCATCGHPHNADAYVNRAHGDAAPVVDEHVAPGPTDAQPPASKKRPGSTPDDPAVAAPKPASKPKPPGHGGGHGPNDTAAHSGDAARGAAPDPAGIPKVQAPVWSGTPGKGSFRIELADGAGFIAAGYSPKTKKLTIYDYRVDKPVAGVSLGKTLLVHAIAACDDVEIVNGYLAGSNLVWNRTGTFRDSHWVWALESLGYTSHEYSPSSHEITSRRAPGEPMPHAARSSDAPGPSWSQMTTLQRVATVLGGARAIRKAKALDFDVDAALKRTWNKTFGKRFKGKLSKSDLKTISGGGTVPPPYIQAVRLGNAIEFASLTNTPILRQVLTHLLFEDEGAVFNIGAGGHGGVRGDSFIVDELARDSTFVGADARTAAKAGAAAFAWDLTDPYARKTWLAHRNAAAAVKEGLASFYSIADWCWSAYTGADKTGPMRPLRDWDAKFDAWNRRQLKSGESRAADKDIGRGLYMGSDIRAALLDELDRVLKMIKTLNDPEALRRAIYGTRSSDPIASRGATPGRADSEPPSEAARSQDANPPQMTPWQRFLTVIGGPNALEDAKALDFDFDAVLERIGPDTGGTHGARSSDPRPPPRAPSPVWAGQPGKGKFRIDLAGDAGFIEASYSPTAKKLTVYDYRVSTPVPGVSLGKILLHGAVAACGDIELVNGYLAGTNLVWNKTGTFRDSHWVWALEALGFTEHRYDPSSHEITSRRPAASPAPPPPAGAKPDTPANPSPAGSAPRWFVL